MSHNAWVTNTDESKRERRHESLRARRRQLFFLEAQARKLLLSASLAWTERALKCHPRNSDGDSANELLSVSSVFWVYPSVLVLFGRSCGLKTCDCDRHGFFFNTTTGVRCAMVCPRSPFVEVHDLSHQSWSSTKLKKADGLPRGRWPSVNMPRQVGSTPQIRFNPIQKKHFWTSSSIGLNRISLTPQWKCLLGYSFFHRSDHNSIQSNSKS